MDDLRRQSDVSRISKVLDAEVEGDDRRRSVALSTPVIHQRSGKMGRVASFFGGDKEELESLRNQLASAQAEAAALRMDIQGTKEAHKKQLDDLINQHALEIRGRQMQFRNAIQAAKEEAAAEREAATASAQLQASDSTAQLLHQAQERSNATIAALKSQHQATIQQMKETTVAEVARVRGETRAERDAAVAEAQALVAAVRQESSDEIGRAKAEVANVRAEIEAVKAECQKLLAEAESRHAADLEAAAASHRQAIADLQASYDHQKEAADKEYTAKVDGDLVRLNKEIASLNAEVSTLRGASESAETLAAVHDKLRSEIAALSDEHAQTVAGLKAAQKDEVAAVCTRLQSEFEGQLASVVEHKQKQYEAELLSLKLASDSENAALRAELAAQANKILNLERDLDRGRADSKQALEEQRTSLEAAAAAQMLELRTSHASEVEQLHQRHELELDTVRQAAAGDIEDYRVQFETVSNQFTVLERSHAAAMEAARQRLNAEVEAAVSRTKREHDAALAKLRTSHTSEIASLRGQLVALALEASQDRQAALDEAARTAASHVQAIIATERQKQEGIRATIGEACRELRDTVAAMKKDAVDLEEQHARLVEAIKARHASEVDEAAAKAKQDAADECSRTFDELKARVEEERERDAKRFECDVLAIKASNEAGLSELTAKFESTIASIQAGHAREIEELTIRLNGERAQSAEAEVSRMRAEADSTIADLRGAVATMEAELQSLRSEILEKQAEHERLLTDEKIRHQSDVEAIQALSMNALEEARRRFHGERDELLQQQHQQIQDAVDKVRESYEEQLVTLRGEVQSACTQLTQLTCSEIVSNVITKSIASHEIEELRRSHAEELERLRSSFNVERAESAETRRMEVESAISSAQAEASQRFDVMLDNLRTEWSQQRDVDFAAVRQAMRTKFMLDTQSAQQVLKDSLQALVTDHEAGMSAIYTYCGSLSERVDGMAGWLRVLKGRCSELSSEIAHLNATLQASKQAHSEAIAHFDCRVAELQAEHQRLLDSLSEVAVDGCSEDGVAASVSATRTARVDLTPHELVDTLKRRLRLSESSRKDLASRVQSQIKAAVSAAVELERQSQCEQHETELARAQVVWMNKLSAEQVAQEKVLAKLDGEWRDRLSRADKQKAAEMDIVRAECEQQARERVHEAIQPLLSQIRALKAQIDGTDLSRSAEAWKLMQHLAQPHVSHGYVDDRANSRGPTPEPPDLGGVPDETASLDYSHTVSIEDDVESKTGPEDRRDAPRRFVRNRVLPPPEPKQTSNFRNASPSPSVRAVPRVSESPGRPPVRSRSATRLSTTRSPGTPVASPHATASAPKFPITSGNPKPGFNSSAKRVLL